MSGTSIFAQIFTSLTSYNAVQNHVQSSVIALALDLLQALSSGKILLSDKTFL